jgi:hypothetical protein
LRPPIIANGSEQRRRAGIPDNDTRPWLIARPAAELRMREEARDRAEAKARAEAEVAEKKRLEEKRGEVSLSMALGLPRSTCTSQHTRPRHARRP